MDSQTSMHTTAKPIPAFAFIAGMQVICSFLTASAEFGNLKNAAVAYFEYSLWSV